MIKGATSAQTMNLVLGFMVWVIISALLPFIREDISIAADRLAILTAIPVVLGSVLRIPLGYYANVVGARIVLSPALSCRCFRSILSARLPPLRIW